MNDKIKSTVTTEFIDSFIKIVMYFTEDIINDDSRLEKFKLEFKKNYDEAKSRIKHSKERQINKIVIYVLVKIEHNEETKVEKKEKMYNCFNEIRILLENEYEFKYEEQEEMFLEKSKKIRDILNSNKEVIITMGGMLLSKNIK